MGSPTTAFIVTVDTEGDNLWARPRWITTENARFLPRFQALCEAHGLRPTWLVNHEMAECPEFLRLGREVVQRATGEIGLHVHAWNSPPLVPRTSDDFRHQPFLVEYPLEVMEAKVEHLLRLLRDRFECEIRSHRAGRWALDARYAKVLARQGIRVDCSVTPGVDWSDSRGAPDGQGGADYRGFPAQPYFLDVEHIDRPASDGLLEVPVSVRPSALNRHAPWAYRWIGLRRWAWRSSPRHVWLYPDGCNLAGMLALVQEAERSHWAHLEFVIHSSELMPGGSPNFPDEASIDSLYRDLETLFAAAARFATGMTLSQFRAHWLATQTPATATRRETDLCPQ